MTTQETVVWRFPWKRIDPARVDQAVASALGDFPGARVTGKGVLATAADSPGAARTFVIAFPVDLVASSLEAYEEPPMAVDGMAYGRFAVLADDELGAGALLEAKRNEGIFPLMKKLLGAVAKRLDGVEDGAAPIAKEQASPACFDGWAELVAYAKARRTLEDVEEDSFATEVSAPGAGASQLVEVLTYDAWDEPWIVFWSTICDASKTTADDVVRRNADATFAVMAQDEDVYRVCWSCPLRILTGPRLEGLLSRFAEEAVKLRGQLDPDG